MTQSYSGGCQCGKVRYEVSMDIADLIACNCSRCRRLGSLLAFAPALNRYLRARAGLAGVRALQRPPREARA